MPRYHQWKKYLCYSQDNLDRVKKLWVIRKVFSTAKDLFIQKRVSLKAIEEDILLIYLASKRTRLNISVLIIGIRYALRVGGKGMRVVKQRQLDSCKVSPTSKYRRRRARSSLSLPPNKQKVPIWIQRLYLWAKFRL